MTVPDDVREALVAEVYERSVHGTQEDAVDIVLAHLEQVGWLSPHGTYYTMGSPLNDAPVYRFRKEVR